MKDMKELWETYTKGGIKWKHRLVKFVIDNPEIVLKDDKIWEEFCKYIKDLHLYYFPIDSTTDRLMVVQTVKINYHLIIEDKYIYY